MCGKDFSSLPLTLNVSRALVVASWTMNNPCCLNNFVTKPEKIIYIKGIWKLSNAQQVAAAGYPSRDLFAAFGGHRSPICKRRFSASKHRRCHPAPSPSPRSLTPGMDRGSPSPGGVRTPRGARGERSRRRRPRSPFHSASETRGVGERGEGAREPGSQTPPAGREHTREGEGAGWIGDETKPGRPALKVAS